MYRSRFSSYYVNMLRVDIEHWDSLCRRMGANKNINFTYQTLWKNYRASSLRIYHTFEHVTKCLEVFDSLRHLALKSDECEMAIWFHDSVYNSQSQQNEEMSAAFADECLYSMGIISDRVRSKVETFILSTKYSSAPSNMEEQIISDSDLAIFGQSSEVYDVYEEAVRDEYSWVSDELFWKKRKEILTRFLDRESIYYTDPCRWMYEQSARNNIQRSLSR